MPATQAVRFRGATPSPPEPTEGPIVNDDLLKRALYTTCAVGVIDPSQYTSLTTCKDYTVPISERVSSCSLGILLRLGQSVYA